MQLTLIDEIFCCQLIAIYFGKFIQCTGAYCKVIRCPVRIKLSVAFTTSPDPDEIIEHGSKTNYCRSRMLLTPVLHPVLEIFLCLRIYRINLHQVLFIPMVRCMIIHRDLFPDTVSQEAYCIGMPWSNIMQFYAVICAVVAPLIRRNNTVSCSIIYLPVFESCFAVINTELFIKEIIHKSNVQCILCRYLG